MWHEARRQEKKIRGIMVDYKRRADRRREFYEKIKQDPAQFLRMYGRPVKIHLDQAVAMAAEGPQSMMPWQGDHNNMIDRFDVRANLDYIPEYVPDKHRASDTHDDDERQANYERYRTLVENEAAALSEEQCLHQIYLDEHFGTISKGNEEEKKKNSDKKAAIGYVYEGSTLVTDKAEDNEDSEEDEILEDIETADLDVTIDVDVLTPDQIREVNQCAAQYGMKDDDFIRLLRKDKEELEALRAARQLEEAKAQFSGRKSRRERRAINEKRQNPQRFSRPSYAARESPKYEPYKRPGSSSRSRSRSRSRSSEPAPVKFITSFGAESDDEGGGVVQGPSLPSNSKSAAKKRTSQREPSKCETPWLSRHNSSQKESRSRSRRSLSHSRSRSRSRNRGKHRSSSKSSFSSDRSYSRSKSRSRSWSRSGNRRSPSARQGNNGRSGPTGSKRERRSHSNRSSVSRSRSGSQSRSSKAKSVNRSESPAKKPVIKRYRRESLSTDSELSGLESDDEQQKNNLSPQLSTSSKNELNRMSDSTKSGKISSKPQIFQGSSTGPKKTPQELLKKRMQAQLTRQFKADKKAEITKITKQEQERMDREEEIRTLALEMRRREREKRHREREEEEKERRERRKNRHSDRGSQSGDSSDSSDDSSNAASPEANQSSGDSPETTRDVSRVKADRKAPNKQAEGGKEERRRGASSSPPPSHHQSDERRNSGERRWEGRRDRSRWEESEGREKGRGPRGERWDGPSGAAATSRWSDERSYDRNWTPDTDRWAGRQRGWSNPRRQNRLPPAAFRSRGSRSLVPRSRSPLMSRPRPPSDPRLLEEPLNFD